MELTFKLTGPLAEAFDKLVQVAEWKPREVEGGELPLSTDERRIAGVNSAIGMFVSRHAQAHGLMAEINEEENDREKEAQITKEIDALREQYQERFNEHDFSTFGVELVSNN